MEFLPTLEASFGIHINTTSCLLYLQRIFNFFSNFELFYHEIDKLETIFEKNSYTKSFIDFCVRKYLHKNFINKERASKKVLIQILSFIGKKPLQLRTHLVNSTENYLKFCKLKVLFQSPWKLNLLFRYKDFLKKRIHSEIVYRYTCSNSKVTYYRKICRHIFTRAAEYMGISNLTGKRL